jgi:hypothetical protein
MYTDKGVEVPKQSKLTPEIHQTIVEAVRAGNFFSTACRMAGIKENTGYGWLARGRGIRGTPGRVYQDFAKDIEAAEPVAEIAALRGIIEIGNGVEFIKKSKTFTKPDGTRVEEVERELVRDWKAFAWYLERKYPQRWGKQKIAEVEAVKILLEGNRLPVEVVDRIIEASEIYQESIASALGNHLEKHSSSTAPVDSADDDEEWMDDDED